MVVLYVYLEVQLCHSLVSQGHHCLVCQRPRWLEQKVCSVLALPVDPGDPISKQLSIKDITNKMFSKITLWNHMPLLRIFFFKSSESFQRVFIIFVYKNTGMITHTFSEARSSLDSITSLIVWLTTLMTRSMTCTTPLVAIWLPWMILAQFTVTTCKIVEKEFSDFEMVVEDCSSKN